MKFAKPPLPTEATSEQLADWAELVALVSGRITRGNLTTAAGKHGLSATVVADAWLELESRVRFAVNHSVFAINAVSLTRVGALGRKHVWPAFLSALSLGENVTNAQRELFEGCVSEVVRAIVPESQKLGDPRKAPIPKGFSPALQAYASVCGEAVQRKPRPSDKDLKLDVVAWLPFADKRGGYLHLVGQCATGANWETKLDELNLQVVASHLNWWVWPLRFFATPVVVPETKMERCSRRGGVLLDRPRLIELAKVAPLSLVTRKALEKELTAIY